VQSILRSPYYAAPLTENMLEYEFYRGRTKASVLTLRFNVTPTFHPGFVQQTILTTLMSRFPLQTKLLGSVHYDLLLVDRLSQSYYIFKANSNQRRFDEANERLFTLTYANVQRFTRDIADFNVGDLDVYFASSKVNVDRVLAVVVTFVH